MGRYRQKSNGKGSLKLIQTLVNEYSHVFNSKLAHITGEQITWISPLESDEYAEYRDTAFLEKLKVNTEAVEKLKDFWPRNGPQWDALGKFGDNGVLLVEAKANLPELVSPPSSATSPISQQLIAQSLEETKAYIDATPGADWSGIYYQYLNRITHLYFLRVLHNVPAFLVMIYFIGDQSVTSPTSEDEWKVAIQSMHQTLGIPNKHSLDPYILNLFIHVNELGR